MLRTDSGSRQAAIRTGLERLVISNSVFESEGRHIMDSVGFIHLRVRSSFSLCESMIKIPDLIKYCSEMSMPAVALTDVNNLFGAVSFSKTAASAGIQPIIGCLLGISPLPSITPSSSVPHVQEPTPLLLLAKDSDGLSNLMALISAAYLNPQEPNQPPQVALAAFAERNSGLIALTGGPMGPVGRLLAAGQHKQAEEMLCMLKDLFADRLYIELMRHGLAVEAEIEPVLLELAYRYDIPLIATNDVHFAHATQSDAHHILRCIAGGKHVDDPTLSRLTSEHYLKSTEAMRHLFRDLPEAVDNSLVIAQRCAVMLTDKAPILPSFPTESGRDLATELQVQATIGLEKRLAVQSDHDHRADTDNVTYQMRLEHELSVISSMGYAGYYLIVADFIAWARTQKIPVGPGRGSGAGSLVAWCLGITNINPIRYGLLFERFLNAERISMPDFDIDFCQERRDEVIRYVQTRYGEDKVAQIITFGKMLSRAVLRDVGRVLGMPYGQVDRLCKLIPYNPAQPIPLAIGLQNEPAISEMRMQDPVIDNLFTIALQLEGLHRHCSTHAAGMVIADRPLQELVPLYCDYRANMPVTQFSMKDVEAIGLVKFDFLGLKTLTVIEMAVQLLHEMGIVVDLETIALDDEKTYKMLESGAVQGVFQFESTGMQTVLHRLKPDRFEDLIAIVSLYRPGPMNSIPTYIARKQGREKLDYLHPALEPVLRETYGVITYQEQVLQIAQIVANFSLGQADILRAAMGKKNKEIMEQQYEKFIEGAVSNGYELSFIKHLFELIRKFSEYGFNKCHAAPYALISYRTAWLKANYPVAFLAASMTHDAQNVERLAGFCQEAARMGIAVLPPDVNQSAASFTIQQQDQNCMAIRYGLAALKNVSEQAVQVLVASRLAGGGEFTDLADFAERVEAGFLHKRMIESLAKAGAFDALHANRRQVHDGADIILRYGATVTADRKSGQTILFGDRGVRPDPIRLPNEKKWTEQERGTHEFEAFGFYFSTHPLEAASQILQRLGVIRHQALIEQAKARGGEVRGKLAGLFIKKKERNTKNREGGRFAFATFSDPDGSFEVALFQETLTQTRSMLIEGTKFVLSVSAKAEGEESVRLTAQSLEPIELALTKMKPNLDLYLADESALASIHDSLATVPLGSSKVTLILDLCSEGLGEVTLDLGVRYTVTPDLLSSLNNLSGIRTIQYA